MALGRHRGAIQIIYDGKVEVIGATIISYHLPGLWQHGNVDPRIYSHLEDWIEDSTGKLVDEHMQKALRYLFDFVKDIDHNRSSGRLLDKLEASWKNSSHGSNKTLRLFKSLGTILRPEIFGCGPEISSPMISFLTRHISEIIHGSPKNWIGYIQVLEDIDIEETDMRNVLSYVAKEINLKSATLHRYRFKFSNGTLYLLDQIAHDKRERRHELRSHFERHLLQKPHGLGIRDLVAPPHVRGGGFAVPDRRLGRWNRHGPSWYHGGRIGQSDLDWDHDEYFDDDEDYLSDPSEFSSDRYAIPFDERRHPYDFPDDRWDSHGWS